LNPLNIHLYIHLQKKYKRKSKFFDLNLGEKEMKNIKDLKNHSKDDKKNFSLLTCKKDEFKDWFDPL
jgi:hypothetical protein